MLSHEITTEDLDFSLDGMTPTRQPGRLVRDGEKRYLVKRLTSKGVVPVRRCRTREQADHIAIPGLDVIEEVAA